MNTRPTKLLAVCILCIAVCAAAAHPDRPVVSRAHDVVRHDHTLGLELNHVYNRKAKYQTSFLVWWRACRCNHKHCTGKRATGWRTWERGGPKVKDPPYTRPRAVRRKGGGWRLIWYDQGTQPRSTTCDWWRQTWTMYDRELSDRSIHPRH